MENSKRWIPSRSLKGTPSGTADEVSLEGSGVSSIVAEDMKLKDAEIDLSGTAKASIYVTRRLDVECSGASSAPTRQTSQ